MAFSNPVVGGSTLVRNAIQSQDFSAGVSGWAIFRTGAAEFNNVTVRGTVIAGGGNVVLNASGIDVKDTGGTVEYLVNRTGGFVARNIPNNGAQMQMGVIGLFMTPQNPTPLGNTVAISGQILVGTSNPVGSVERVNIQLFSPALAGHAPRATILLEGESTAGDRAKITLGASNPIDLHINGYVEDGDLHDIRNHQARFGESARFLISGGPFTSATFNVTFTNAFSSVPHVDTVIESGAGVTNNWSCRPISITTAGFIFFIYAPPGGAAVTWANVPVSWNAMELT